MALAAIIALLAAADLIVKEWIERQKPENFPRPVAKTGERLWLYRNHNGGFPFGFMEKHGELVRGVPLAVISCLSGFLLCLMQNRGHKGQKAGLVLVLAGGISNLYDRCVRRYVVDYANLRLGFLKKVVFNLGDLFVLAGTVLLMLLQLPETGRGKKEKTLTSKLDTNFSARSPAVLNSCHKFFVKTRKNQGKIRENRRFFG